MKILFTQETDWLERYPGQQHHLAEMLSLRGHEVRAIDYELKWRRKRARELRSRRKVFTNVSKVNDSARVTVIRPSIVKIRLLDYVSLAFSYKQEVYRQIKEFTPDVIVGLGILAYLAGKAAKKSDLPFVYYWTDVNHQLIPFKALQPIGWLMERRTLRLADKVFVINDKLGDYVMKLGAPPERIQLLGAGINFARFDPNTSGDKIRKQYGVGEEDLVLFFMGWLYNFSGLKEIALELAQIDSHNIKLLIVGEGDAYDELQRMREKHNLQDRVILTGKRPYQELDDYIAASDICLLPAYPSENIMQNIVPIKMYEYMAMKKPVIATKLPGVMKEFGEDNGVVYIDRAEDAVEKAAELVACGSLNELGSRARRFVEQYSWDNITDAFERFLKEVIEK